MRAVDARHDRRALATTAEVSELEATMLARFPALGDGASFAWRATVRAEALLDVAPSLPRVALAPAASPGIAPPSVEAESDLVLTSSLGRGGMGEVWLATQRSLAREVAVKFPLAAHGAAASQLVAEARVAGTLEHPHVVPIHALGRAPDGCPVIVMKRVAGATLDRLVDDGAHPAWGALLRRFGDRESAILETILRVADALEYAHSRGVLHLDIKPENVMVGSFGEVYLMDWGCAARVDDAARAGLAGTPAFMAPEMFRADGAAIDVRTDVYLLGSTLHAALTGHPRHSGGSLAEVIGVALESCPVDYGEAVDDALAALCNRATSRSPEARFPDVAAFRDALGSAIRLRSVRALVRAVVARVAPEREEPPSTDRLQRLREARHALRPLASEWPGEPSVVEALDRVLEALVHTALALERLDDAEQALAERAVPDPTLTARVEQLREATERDRRLTELGASELRDRDARPGLRGVAAMVAFMGVNAALLVSVIGGVEAPTMLEVVATDLAACAFVTAGALAFRRKLTANRRSRATTAAFFTVLVGLTVCDGLSAYVGQSAAQSAPFALLMNSFGLAAIAVLLEMPRGPRRAAGLCSALLAVEAFASVASPHLATRWLALSTIESLGVAAYLVFDMAREAHGTGAPGSGDSERSA